MDGGIIESMLIGSAIGAGTSVITGNDPLKGALLGGLGSGVMGGLMGAGGAAGGAGAAPSGTAPLTSAGAVGVEAANAGIAGLPGVAPTSVSAGIPSASAAPMVTGTPALPPSFVPPAAPVITPATPPVASGGIPDLMQMGPPPVVPPSISADAAAQVATDTAAAAPTSMMGELKDWWSSLPIEKKLMYGVGGSLAGSMLMENINARNNMPGEEKYKGPLSKFRYDPSYYVPSVPYADGGIATLSGGNIAVGGDPRRNTSPLAQSSMPVDVMAEGGIANLGSYSDGGRLLKGPGDGMSDNIPATIGRKQPARLADGEFVVPADVVSHLGNGSTDAGAKQLYAMMDKVRRARTGRKSQGREINPRQFMPA